MYLTQFLHRAQQGQGARTALVCGDTRRSYSELLDRAARLAAALKRLGVTPGDRVGLLSLNSIECVEMWFAVWWIGAAVCPLNTRWSTDEIAFALNDAGVKVLLVDAEHAPQLDTLRQRGAHLHQIITTGDAPTDAGLAYETLIAYHPPIADARAGGSDLAALVYTGGTTGSPKGVMLTHDNLGIAAIGRLADNGHHGERSCLLTTPMFHIAALSRVLPYLASGGSVVIVPRFRAALALDLIARERITDLPVVPTMLQMLLEDPAFDTTRLRSLQRLAFGAAPITATLIARASQALPWVDLYQAYGLTESSAAGTMTRGIPHLAPGSVMSSGRACTTIELRIVDPDGRDVPPGVVGEIVLRGPTITPGYWQRPDETARALRDGWLHTGDGGLLDADGALHVVDRLKDMIISGGENVYSAEVERVLATHPAVAQSAVIGVPHERWGEAVHAVVVLRPGAQTTATELQAHCREQLAGYKCPKSVAFVAELPLTAAGKVSKPALRQNHGDPGQPAAAR